MVMFVHFEEKKFKRFRRKQKYSLNLKKFLVSESSEWEMFLIQSHTVFLVFYLFLPAWIRIRKTDSDPQRC